MCLCWHWLENVIFPLSQCPLYKGLALISEGFQNIYLWKSIYSAICNRYQSININILYEIDLLYPSFKFLSPHEQNFMCHIQRLKAVLRSCEQQQATEVTSDVSDSTCVTWGLTHAWDPHYMHCIKRSVSPAKVVCSWCSRLQLITTACWQQFLHVGTFTRQAKGWSFCREFLK